MTADSRGKKMLAEINKYRIIGWAPPPPARRGRSPHFIVLKRSKVYIPPLRWACCLGPCHLGRGSRPSVLGIGLATPGQACSKKITVSTCSPLKSAAAAAPPLLSSRHILLARREPPATYGFIPYTPQRLQRTATVLSLQHQPLQSNIYIYKDRDGLGGTMGGP